MQIDTGSDVLWVFGEECKDADLNCKDHNKFDLRRSTTFQKEKGVFDLQYLRGKVSGKVGRDDVYITDGLEAKKQLFGSASKVDSPRTGYDGLLGNIY